MNLTRSTFLVAGLALLASACGDDVTVTETPAPTQTAVIRSVSVAPATATVNTGASITFQAAVVADPGLTPTVSWSASAGAITAAGVFTAPTTANPGIAICATATAGTQSARGCATVVVTSTAPTLPAQVSIASVNVNGNLNTTVDPNNVAGLIDVRVNVIPNGNQIDSVRVLLGGTRVDAQSFTAAQAAEMRYLADQQNFPQLVFTVNTAFYNVATGAVRHANGPRALRVEAFVRGGGAASSGSAQQNLVLRNVSGFHVSRTLDAPVAGTTPATTTSATDASGFSWVSGGVTFTAVPVLFGQTDGNATDGTGFAAQTVASATFTWGGAGTCNTGGVAPTRTVTTLTGSAFVATFTRDDANLGQGSTTSVTGYEFAPNLCPAQNQFGEVINIAAVANDGTTVQMVAGVGGYGAGVINNPLNNAGFNQTAGLAMRLDNRAPSLAQVGGTARVSFNTSSSAAANIPFRAAPPVEAGTGTRSNNWLNGAFNPVSVGLTSAVGVTIFAPAIEINNTGFAQGTDGGASRLGTAAVPAGTAPVWEARLGDATASNATIDATAAVGTSLAAVANPDTPVNTAYRFRYRATDALGNVANASVVDQTGASGTTAPRFFGLDRTAPTLAYTPGLAPAANALIVAGTTMQLDANDNPTGGVTGSGFASFGATPVRQNTQAVFVNSTQTNGCHYGTVSATTGLCSGTAGAPLIQTISANFSANAGVVAGREAYYTATSFIRDDAGNVSNTLARTFILDATAPTIGGVLAPAAVGNGAAATFTTLVADNLDLGDITFGARYTGDPIGAFPLVIGNQALDAFNTPLLTNTTASVTVAPFMHSLGTAVGVAGAAVNGYQTQLRDQAQVAGAVLPAFSAATAWAPSITPAIAAVGAGGNTWVIDQINGAGPAATNISRTSAGGVAATATLRALFTVAASGANPCSSRVDWYVLEAVPTAWRRFATSTVPIATDIGGPPPTNRTWAFSATLGATQVPTNGATQIRAVCVSTAGDGLATAADANITVIP